MANRLSRAFDVFPWGLLVGVWGLSFIYEETPLQDMVWCVWRQTLNLACPGCGLTRSFCSMSAGDWAAAFDHHWAGPLLYIAMVWCIFAWAVRFVSGQLRWMTPGRTVLAVYWGVTLVMFLGQVARVAYSWISLLIV